MDKDLAKLLARLTSLKSNIPSEELVSRQYADEFNSILVGLEEFSKENLKDFVILDEKINPRVASFNMLSGKRTYSSEEYCERSFLLMEIDGVLGYFTLLLQPTENKEKLGFNVGEK